ncbi:hypothetical protein [Chlorobium sp. N1]|uniref:AAA family ATPase n=1 Tax=Chlorobium sp. N1 TaxID=2491138 RepID=UPI00103D67F2|nr:hypothetical protein [Chlorobium sp. N1]TCD46806.1 hypothetical protein E0L29_11405 [Chlorobium sp. N1]
MIYGGNGSGKSGYARVMKRACRARDQSEPIHPNAKDPAASRMVPTAKFEVKVAGASEEIEWSLGTISPERLSTISVFDSKCARSYITSEQDVAYLPYGLDIVENLANLVLPKLSETLDAEINGIDVDKLSIEHLIGETEVGKVIETLSVKTNSEQISSLGTLSKDEIKRITDLEAALNEVDPLAKARDLRLSAIRLKTYSVKLAKPLKWVCAEAVVKLQGLAEIKKVAEIAETMAADSLRAGEELLPGTGDQAWKRLFEAARSFSTEVAYPGEEFPPSTESKVCSLCQNALGESGAQRLNRFDEYIKNDVARAADVARNDVETAKSMIEVADLDIIADAALCDELRALDKSLLQTITEFQDSIETRRSAMLRCIVSSKWTEIPRIIESPRPRVRQLAASQFRGFRTLVRAADEEMRKKLGEELSELLARQSLAKSLKAVLELLERMKKKAALEKCRSSLKTRHISDQSKAFASVAVTDELKKSLDLEFKALGIGDIKTKLKARNSRGKMYHQLLLEAPRCGEWVTV